MSRITNRLARLEANSQRQTHDVHRMLVEVLARRDALWWPRRKDHKKNNAGIIKQRQKSDRAGTYGASAKSSGRSQWGDALDTRNSIIVQGLAKPIRTAGGEVAGLSITPQGEADARALVGDRVAGLGTVVTRLIFFYLDLRRESCKGCVSESLLFQRSLVGCPDDWEHLTEAVLPLITAGVVEAIPDTVGRIYYRLLMDDYPPILESTLKSSPEFDEVYVDAFRAELDMLSSLGPCEELVIPLPANCGLHEFYPDDHDPDFEAKREHIEKLETVLGNYGQFIPDDSEVNNGN